MPLASSTISSQPIPAPLDQQLPTTQASWQRILNQLGTWRQILTNPYPQTPAELAAGVTPIYYSYSPGDGRRYGVVGDGVTDDTVALSNTILPAQTVHFIGLSGSTFAITNSLTFVNKGQMIYGDGRNVTKLIVPATFNLSALGVCIISTLEPAPIFRDWAIQFTQPDTATRASLIAYPPAIYGNAQPRLTLQDFKITGAMTGISLTGNSGGCYFDLLELSAFNYGIVIDGALDTMRITKLHFWPWNLTTNQQAIFNDATTVGAQIGRCDGFDLSDSLFIGTLGTSIAFTPTASGSVLGYIDNTDFDSYGAVKVTGSTTFPPVLSFTSCLWTLGSAANQALVLTGAGFIKISASEFDAAVATTNPIVQCINGAAPDDGPSIVISSSIFRLSGDQTAAKVSSVSSTALLSISDCDFFLPQNTSPANPVIWAAAGGRVTFIGNRSQDKGSGTGVLVQCDVDEHHMITENSFLGWNATLPSTAVNLSFYGNNSVLNSGVGTNASNGGNNAFSAATSVTFNHGVNAFGSRVPLISEIIITPDGDPGAGIRWWVSAISASQITLTASAATSMPFGWSVRNPTLSTS